MRAFRWITFILGILTSAGIVLPKMMTVQEALQNTRTIAYPQTGFPVDRTVAEALKAILLPNAQILAAPSNSSLAGTGTLRVAIADEAFAAGPNSVPKNSGWMFFKLSASGVGELVASHPSLLYALFCRVKEAMLQTDLIEFEAGKLLTTKFIWLRGEDGLFAGKQRFSRGYDPESTIRELARLGCSHVVINALATPFSLEVGPPGEIYYRFYDGAPDLDQFVETDLSQGTYPPEYLQANLAFLKKQAQLALKYGLTPGLYICNPRSVPESLLERYPFLRGARVDHPFRSYRPRYNLTLGHPLVRWHYTEMLRKIMAEIPEIGFINTFLNDSGSGFEYTARLYAGRNGGAYITREWLPHEAFAEAASENILRYYRDLRAAGRQINPDFRIIAGLFAIPEEEPLVLQGMDQGLDLEMSIHDKKDPGKWAREQALLSRGSNLFTSTSAKGALIPGIPSPWLTFEKLLALGAENLNHITVALDPPSLAPWSVNREMVQAFQLNFLDAPDALIRKIAIEWVGAVYATDLVEIWRNSDQAVRNFPDVPLYGTSWAFEMYRHWIRPYVPDIDKIPESERAYYEKYLMATFNNPQRVDYARDVLWTLITIDQGDAIVKQYDTKSGPALEQAIRQSQELVKKLQTAEPAWQVVTDLHDRLLAVRCYYRSLRNIGAWIAGVHGYLEARTETEKSRRLEMVRAMVADELQNAEDLLKLWQTTRITFIPISEFGETWHQYGDNLGGLIEKKITLMQQHQNDQPYIDPDYMWRMPAELKSLEDRYLKQAK